MPESDFKNRSKHWFGYKEEKPVEFTPAEYQIITQFTYNAVLINIPKGTVRKYQQYLDSTPASVSEQPNLED